MDLFIEQLINALKTGSIYALVAIGYTMVYGVIKLINFAHGEVMMFGAYFSYLFAFTLPVELPFIVVLLLTMICAGLMGILMERIAYRRLRKAPRISALITAIGLSIFLQNLAELIFGTTPFVMKSMISNEPINIFGFSIARLTILTIFLSVLFMVILTIFIKKTKIGKSMRAVSQDKDTATLMGINSNIVISLTFAIGSALGALGGVLYAMAYVNVESTLGVLPGLKAFVAAVIGGIGNISGAMLGGYLIGIVETFVKGYISTKWAEAIVFSLLIITLLFRPAGLLGKNLKEKV